MKALFLFVNLLAATCVWSQPLSIQWQASNDTTHILFFDWLAPYKTCATVDGGYITVGSGIGVTSAANVAVVKTNDLGQVEWQRTYGGSLQETGNDIIQTQDHGYIFVATSLSNDGDLTGDYLLYSGFSESSGWVVKIDSVGDIQWQKRAGFFNSRLFSICEDFSGNYLAVGDGFDTSNNDILSRYLLTIDNDGGIFEENYIPYSPNNGTVEVSEVRQTSDHKFICVGTNYSSTTSWGTNVSLMKLDSLHNVEWEYLYGAEGIEHGKSVVECSNGDYIITANIFGYANWPCYMGQSDFLILRVNAVGDVLWELCSHGTYVDVIRNVINISDSDVLVLGYTNSVNEFVTDTALQDGHVFIAKINGNGIVEWNKRYPGDVAGSILKNADGSYVYSGGIDSTSIEQKFLLVKLYAEGIAPPSISLSASDTLSCDTAACIADIDLDIETGTPPFTYAWSNGATTEDLTNVCSGIYDVTVTDSTGTSSTASITVNIVPSIIAPAFNVTNASCQSPNGSIDATFSGGVEPYTYLWSDSSTNEDLTNAPPGTYYVTVTDTVGCSTWNGTQIAGFLPVILSLYTVPSCGDSVGAINLNVDNATMPINYNWSTGDSVEDLNNLDSGAYSITVIDALGCSATANTYVEFHTPPIACIATINSPCSCTKPYTVNFIDCSVPAGLQLEWQFFGGTPLTLPNHPEQQVIYNDQGSYAVWLIVTDSFGCTGFAGDNEFVQINDETVSFVGPDTVVIAQSGTFQSFNLDNYDWSVTPNFSVITSSDSSSAFTVFFMQMGIYNVCLASEFVSCDSTCIVEACKTVVVIDSTVSIHQAVLNNFKVIAYPNPTNDIVTFHFNRNLTAPLTLKLFDVAGRVADEIIIPVNINSQQLDERLLPKGVYFYTFESLDKQVIARGKLAIE